MNFVYTHDQNKSLLRNSELRFQFSVAITITRFKLKQKLYKTISTIGSATMHCYTPHFETVRNTVKNAVNISFDVKLFFFSRIFLSSCLYHDTILRTERVLRANQRRHALAATCSNALVHKHTRTYTRTLTHAHTYT